MKQQADGVNGINLFLAEFGTDFLNAFKDWVIANYLDGEGRFGYADRSVKVRELDRLFDYGEKRDTLSQFASRYIDVRLDEGDALVSFQGEAVVTQVNTQCRSGTSCWWGNRGDSIDATLTGEFDLSRVSSATLQFWTWFNLEEDWDYAYISASADNGDTWTLLEGSHTTSDDPNGNNFGAGLTGASGDWIEEKIDLSSYTGGKVLLRFEYITDDTVYLDGFVIDDIAIPEVGFFDDAEQDGLWDARGFERITNVLPQSYFVQVIEVGTDGNTSVREITLDEKKTGQLLLEGFGSRLEHAVIVVSPVTLNTHQPAQYTLTISPP